MVDKHFFYLFYLFDWLCMKAACFIRRAPVKYGKVFMNLSTLGKTEVNISWICNIFHPVILFISLLSDNYLHKEEKLKTHLSLFYLLGLAQRGKKKSEIAGRNTIWQNTLRKQCFMCMWSFPMSWGWEASPHLLPSVCFISWAEIELTSWYKVKWVWCQFSTEVRTEREG